MGGRGNHSSRLIKWPVVSVILVNAVSYLSPRYLVYPHCHVVCLRSAVCTPLPIIDNVDLLLIFSWYPREIIEDFNSTGKRKYFLMIFIRTKRTFGLLLKIFVQLNNWEYWSSSRSVQYYIHPQHLSLSVSQQHLLYKHRIWEKKSCSTNVPYLSESNSLLKYRLNILIGMGSILKLSDNQIE